MQFKATRNCANGFSLPHLPHTLSPKYPKDNANFLQLKLNVFVLCWIKDFKALNLVYMKQHLQYINFWNSAWYLPGKIDWYIGNEVKNLTKLLGMKKRSYISACMRSFSQINLPSKLKSTCCSFFPGLCDQSPHKSHKEMKFAAPVPLLV